MYKDDMNVQLVGAVLALFVDHVLFFFFSFYADLNSICEVNIVTSTYLIGHAKLPMIVVAKSCPFFYMAFVVFLFKNVVEILWLPLAVFLSPIPVVGP